MRKKLCFLLVGNAFAFLPLSALGDKDDLIVGASGEHSAAPSLFEEEEQQVSEVEVPGVTETALTPVAVSDEVVNGIVASLYQSLPNTGVTSAFSWAWSFVCNGLVNPVAHAYNTLTSEMKLLVLGQLRSVVQSLEVSLQAQLEVKNPVIAQALANAVLMKQAIDGGTAVSAESEASESTSFVPPPPAPAIPDVVKRSYLAEAAAAASSSGAATSKKFVKPQGRAMDSVLAEMGKVQLRSASQRQLPAFQPQVEEDWRVTLSRSLDRLNKSMNPDLVSTEE